MTENTVLRFLEAVSQPPDLDEFKAALAESVDALVELGRSKGFRFDAGELRETIAQLMDAMPPPDELSDAQLEAVAGGRYSATSSAGLRNIGLTLMNYEPPLGSWRTHNY
jgi:predicted ribosomally synthesized peptide with nif11-like leader